MKTRRFLVAALFAPAIWTALPGSAPASAQTAFERAREDACGQDPQPQCERVLRQRCGPRPSQACMRKNKAALDRGTEQGFAAERRKLR